MGRLSESMAAGTKPAKLTGMSAQLWTVPCFQGSVYVAECVKGLREGWLRSPTSPAPVQTHDFPSAITPFTGARAVGVMWDDTGSVCSPCLPGSL